MFDRHLIGDVAIAFLLAVPTIAMSRPQSTPVEVPSVSSPILDQGEFADPDSVEKVDLTKSIK